MVEIEELAEYPGGDLVASGLRDLNRGFASAEALLVLVAGPRLRDLGFDVPKLEEVAPPYEHRLYEVLEDRNPKSAYMEYNSRIARIVSFANAYSIGKIPEDLPR